MSRGFRDADATAEMGAVAAARLVERVREVDAAQAQHAAERREQGGYGTCEDCGNPIEPERLAVLPDSTRCVKCQVCRESESPHRF